MKMEIESFVNSLPKVELHAHINGSLSNDTLRKLKHLKQEKIVQDTDQYNRFDKLDLSEGFKKFQYAHALTDTPEAVALATTCVIQDFYDDNVVYVELRTTPRSTSTMSKIDYIEAVISSIINAKVDLPNIMVKLIISINRSKSESISSANENIDLAIKYQKLYPNIVVGVDLSGDPTSKSFSEFKEILNEARQNKLKLALHCGEVDNQVEIADMLEFGMDRLGHGTFISGQNEEILLANKDISLECCLTSNYLCGTVSSYADHHFWRFFKNDHPVVICTDDFGVFNTTLSNEFLIASQTFDLKPNDLIKLCRVAANSSFASIEEKAQIQRVIDAFVKVQNTQR